MGLYFNNNRHFLHAIESNNFLILLISILVPEKLGVVFILIFLLSVIYPLKRVDKRFIGSETWFIIFAFILYYLWNTLSLFWSTDPGSGLKDLEKMTIFFVLPVLFIFRSGRFRISYRRSVMMFVLGLDILLLVCFIISLYKSLINIGFQTWPFKYYNFTYWVGFHPGYLSLLILLGLIFVKFYLLKSSYRNKLFPFYLFSFFFLSFSLFFIGSKFAILTYAVNIFIFALFFFKLYKKVIASFITTVVLLLIAGVLSLNTQNRISNIKESFELRRQLNESSINLIGKNIYFGYGIGSVNNNLYREYKKLNFELAYKDKLNAHNQFLQTFLTSGIIGLILLVCILIFSIRFSFNRKLNILILLQFIFFFTIESALERQRGVVPFIVFIFFIILLQDNDKNIVKLRNSDSVNII